jgi:hypothetical protein
MIFENIILFGSLVAMAAAKRRAIGDMNVSPSKGMRRQPNQFYIVKLTAGLEVIWLQKSPGNDAFFHTLQVDINDNAYLAGEGVLCATRRRRSVEDNSVMINQDSRFPRRVIIRAVDESTPESRNSFLLLLQSYMLRPEINRYNAEYIVNDHSDLTDENNLESLDHYVLNNDIVETIYGMFENTDPSWYANNRDIANQFFTGPVYPRIAIESLGFPDDVVVDNGGGFNDNFNPAPVGDRDDESD